MSSYIRYCKPTLSNALKSIGLDKEYYKARGNYLYYRNIRGEEVRVLDLLGGYGATLVGHFHPQIGERYKTYIDERIPIHNQFSIRRAAGELAVVLNQRLKRETGYQGDFQFCYTTTGAETMEIALKHAEYARNAELDAQHNQIKTSFTELAREAEFFITQEQEKKLGLTGDESPQQIKEIIALYNEAQFNAKPIFLALEHAFHGKMLLTANCTHHPMYRAFLNRLKVETYFLSADSVTDLAYDEAARCHLWGTVLKPEDVNGVVHLIPLKVRRVTAIIAEPVQGEGGVWPLSPATAGNLNILRDIFNCPLIADEVQSGSGRCGALVASADIGLDADYYSLSKALGAGYVKIGVVAIKKSKFADGFDLIQSSTFGEDDLSCKIAKDYLELLFEGKSPLINKVHQLSDELCLMLSNLKAKFPDVIEDVRYRGLLLGIEFKDTTDLPSYMLQNIAAQGSLGYIIAGHLLNACNIRVAPSGSSANVVRFEPSVYLEQRHILLLQESLENVCLAIRYLDVGYLLRPIIQHGVNTIIHPQDYRLSLPEPVRYDSPADYKVTFINHLISAAGLRDVEPSFDILSDKDINDFLINSGFNLSTVPFAPARIRNKHGKTVDFIIHPIPVTSQMIARDMESNNLTMLRGEIDKRVDLAQLNGSHAVGLGMFTSIVTNNGKSVKNNEIAVTTGNALTVGMGIASVKDAYKSRQLAYAKLSIIGAAGNIGSVYAEILGAECHSVLLLGSNKRDSLIRLHAVKNNIYANYYDSFYSGKSLAKGSLGARLKNIFINMPADIHQQCRTAQAGHVISDYLLCNYPQELFISVSQNINDVVDSDIIVCATNATNTILPLKQLKQEAVICDIAVPHNVQNDDLIHRPDLILLRGGVIKTPHDDGLDPRVRAYLGKNQLYACMTETILMALEEYTGHYSYGNITPSQVEKMMELAELHGFTLAGAKKESSL